jgi:hypothetical protein
MNKKKRKNSLKTETNKRDGDIYRKSTTATTGLWYT